MTHQSPLLVVQAPVSSIATGRPPDLPRVSHGRPLTLSGRSHNIVDAVNDADHDFHSMPIDDVPSTSTSALAHPIPSAPSPASAKPRAPPRPVPAQFSRPLPPKPAKTAAKPSAKAQVRNLYASNSKRASAPGLHRLPCGAVIEVRWGAEAAQWKGREGGHSASFFRVFSQYNTTRPAGNLQNSTSSVLTSPPQKKTHPTHLPSLYGNTPDTARTMCAQSLAVLGWRSHV